MILLDPLSSLYAVFLVSALVLLMTRRRHTASSQGRALPPGPPGKPIIGSILEITRHDAPRVFMQYGKQYGKHSIIRTRCRVTQSELGDLILLHGLGKRVLVLNSLQAMNDLLDKRASKYSHRPHSVFAGDLLDLKNVLVIHSPPS